MTEERNIMLYLIPSLRGRSVATDEAIQKNIFSIPFCFAKSKAFATTFLEQARKRQGT
jgi:hypothetical protein